MSTVAPKAISPGMAAGEHRAVLIYQIDSYEYWERQLCRKNVTFGQFGETFTDRSADDEVCIGDRYRFGTALFAVTQPSVTCYLPGHSRQLLTG